jgi:hypothetical protein
MSAFDRHSQENEPDLQTNSHPCEILAELSNREPISHRPEYDALRADFEGTTAETSMLPNGWKIVFHQGAIIEDAG